jgi:glycosyltransferase involved in cell wall biosynthesis
VLSDETAFLADPTPEAFASAIVTALEDPVRARAIGERARALAESKYSDDAFIGKTRTAIAMLLTPAREEAAGGLA